MMQVDADTDVDLLKTQIKYLENELKKYQDQAKIQFMCAALASTPDNFHPLTAASRAMQMVHACLEALK